MQSLVAETPVLQIPSPVHAAPASQKLRQSQLLDASHPRLVHSAAAHDATAAIMAILLR
eukprot:CAMPEP_0172080398 /NCGR_PEP_ID=MMETSP1043-20130122/18712_1 /TAXON_ID=464988 /ORGANISM="Hemiselmis andersenii, Strain CCMP441" /LENGTH=58 /DNA_ID=CAMNT_0012741699 /DNA_START=63 /DNA_END=239 /DNA_ORIENTATION=+